MRMTLRRWDSGIIGSRMENRPGICQLGNRATATNSFEFNSAIRIAVPLTSRRLVSQTIAQKTNQSTKAKEASEKPCPPQAARSGRALQSSERDDRESDHRFLNNSLHTEIDCLASYPGPHRVGVDYIGQQRKRHDPKPRNRQASKSSDDLGTNQWW